MTSLAHLTKGSRATVMSLPHPHVLAKRLCALGLNPGAEVRVLQNRGSGPLIIEVHGARLALGRRQADRVAVEPVETPDFPADPAAEA
jgi:Fe2+ transport system protein FeoA